MLSELEFLLKEFKILFSTHLSSPFVGLAKGKNCVFPQKILIEKKFIFRFSQKYIFPREREWNNGTHHFLADLIGNGKFLFLKLLVRPKFLRIPELCFFPISHKSLLKHQLVQSAVSFRSGRFQLKVLR